MLPEILSLKKAKKNKIKIIPLSSHRFKAQTMASKKDSETLLCRSPETGQGIIR